jgi:hypothetical protein
MGFSGVREAASRGGHGVSGDQCVGDLGRSGLGAVGAGWRIGRRLPVAAGRARAAVVVSSAAGFDPGDVPVGIGVATIRVLVSAAGYQQLRRFAGRWPQASWAIEGVGGLGAPLATRLCGEGIAVVDVPAKLAARVRLLSTGHGRKNDDADATSVGIAALTAAGLPHSGDRRGGHRAARSSRTP